MKIRQETVYLIVNIYFGSIIFAILIKCDFYTNNSFTRFVLENQQIFLLFFVGQTVYSHRNYRKIYYVIRLYFF